MLLASMLARYWPFANGSGRFIDTFAKNVDLGSGESIGQTSDGFSMHVLADDLIGRHILLSGKFDRSIVGLLLERGRHGDVLLDVGANIGYVSACFLANVPNSTAICIEPQAIIADLLRKNMVQFGSRAKIHQVALSDKSGELRFQVNRDNRGASRISEQGQTTVPAINAVELLSALEKLDMVKIDVEGHEETIFRAIEGQLKRLHPRAILFEDQTGSAAPDGPIGRILARSKYNVFGVAKGLFKTRLIPVRYKEDCHYNDYLALQI